MRQEKRIRFRWGFAALGYVVVSIGCAQILDVDREFVLSGGTGGTPGASASSSSSSGNTNASSGSSSGNSNASSSSSSGMGGNSSGMAGMGGIGGMAGAGGTGGIGGVGGSMTGSGGDGGTVVVFSPVNCAGQTYLCGDAIDNDGDGLTDWQDPDCLGPCDNSEGGLNLDTPGGDGPACMVDCYWDLNWGAGNDGCYWNHVCDPLSPEGSACTYNMNANTPGTPLSCDELLNQQPASCLTVCTQLVPNGCDCFGCCVLYKNGIEYGPVWLGTEDGNGNSTCNLDKLGTPGQDSACAPCTQVKNECYNGCGTCELCIGKTVADLPPECFQPSPPPQCPMSVQSCGLPGQALCPNGYYCITGCCVPQP